MEGIRLIASKHLKIFILLGIFLLLIVVMTILSPDKFLTPQNFTSMAFQMSEFGILALGMTVVVLTGGVNLSITYSAMLSAILGTMLMKTMLGAQIDPVLTVLAGVAAILLLSFALGFFNGLFVSYVGVLSILVTLGTRSIFEGIGLDITKGSAVSGLPGPFQFFGNAVCLGVPVPFIIFAVTAVVVTLLVERSSWGISVYMIGGNAKVAEFSGINTKRVLMGVYLLSGVLAGLAGIIMTSRYNSARTDYGSSYLMQCVAATVLGGTDINGGAGTVAGTVIAVAIMQVISTGLNIFGANRNLVDIISGAILLAVLTINFLVERDRLGKGKATKASALGF